MYTVRTSKKQEIICISLSKAFNLFCFPVASTLRMYSISTHSGWPSWRLMNQPAFCQSFLACNQTCRLANPLHLDLMNSSHGFSPWNAIDFPMAFHHGTCSDVPRMFQQGPAAPVWHRQVVASREPTPSRGGNGVLPRFRFCEGGEHHSNTYGLWRLMGFHGV